MKAIVGFLFMLNIILFCIIGTIIYYKKIKSKE